jgi:hypothetical protein
MSDIENHSYGYETSSWGSIQTSLTEMERRLGELQDQLVPRQRITHAQGSTHIMPATGVAHGAVGASAGGAGLATGASAQASASSAIGAVDTVRAGLVPPPFGADPAARQSAEEILNQARATAHEVLTAAEAQVSVVKEQIERLLQARETLKGSLVSALAECESLLQGLERGEQPRQHVSGERLPGGSPSGRGSDGIGSALVDGLPFAPAPGVSTPEQLSMFEGDVSLRVGPLRDISQVDTLEIALLQVPGAERVEVKEFAGRDAVAVIKLFQPVPLVEELRRVLPFQFEVAAAHADALTLIAVEDGEAGRPHDAADSLPALGAE